MLATCIPQAASATSLPEPSTLAMQPDKITKIEKTKGLLLKRTIPWQTGSKPSASLPQVNGLILHNSIKNSQAVCASHFVFILSLIYSKKNEVRGDRYKEFGKLF